ncbi:MAG: hypothetical protein V4509_00405 [Patescibacteria group bacterium]
MKSILKTYFISSIITFLSVFSLTLVVSYGSVDPVTMQQQASVALILTAIRAGVKALVEYISTKLTEKYVK